MSALLEISSLDLNAGNSKRILIKNLNLKIEKGELIALVGLNGTGKSTLLNAINGSVKNYQGEIIIKGQNCNEISILEKSKLISQVFTSQENIPWMDVYSFISLGRAPYNSGLGKLQPDDLNKIEETISLTGLVSFKNRFLQDLSDGERQRCFIAQALVQDTPLVLLDEPTSFLDVRHKKQIIELLKNYAVTLKKTFIFSTHDLGFAKCYASKIWWLTDETIQEMNPKDFSEELLH